MDSDDDEDGYSCMELPSLIKQLKAVLDQYPDDGQILKELIQNAEDAEAREVKILFDGRDVRPPVEPRLMKKHPYLAALQAPAICVQNNALFTDKDWLGIKMLHNSVKEEEPLKVGRFGLGFKSIFHLTDYPTIISGDRILFINPQERNLEKVCYMKRLASLSTDTKQLVNKVLSGAFEFTQATIEKGYYNGTIMWFPLRRHPSKLSDNIYTEAKARDLFKAFKAESSLTILFLKFIEKIQLFERPSSSAFTIQLLFTLQISQSCLLNVRSQREHFTQQVKKLNGGIPASSIEECLTLNVETEDAIAQQSSSFTWIVINFYKGGTISARFRELCADQELSYCPYVGLAVPVGQQCQGHIFCFLPLPLGSHSPTGLQVHVNGFFALSQNRRYVKWPTADQNENRAHTDKAIEWNQCLVDEVLPEVYCHLLRKLVRHCEQQGNPLVLQKQVYSLVPLMEDIAVNWKRLASRVLQHIPEIPFLYTPNAGGQWICLTDSIVIPYEHTTRTLITDILLMYKNNIVAVPSKLLKTLQDSHPGIVKETTPLILYQILRTHDVYKQLDRQKKLELLQYLLESESSDCLKGLHLLPLADGSFAEFDKPGQTICFCQNEKEILLFPGLERKFLSWNIPTVLLRLMEKRAAKGINSLALMTASTFPKLLAECLSFHGQSGESCLSFPKPPLTVKWIEQVWTYISAHRLDVMDSLSTVAILPDIDTSGRGFLHRPDGIFISETWPGMRSLPDCVGSALRKLGVVNLKYTPDFVMRADKIAGLVLHYPSLNGINNVLDQVCIDGRAKTSANAFNVDASKAEKEALSKCLSRNDGEEEQLKHGTLCVLQKLQLFLDMNSVPCSVEEVNIVACRETLPVPYPQRCIQYSPSTSRILALNLGCEEQSFHDVCCDILRRMVRDDREYANKRTSFMEFLMEKHHSVLGMNHIKGLASQLRYLSSSDGRPHHKASDLFDPDDRVLKDLFHKEDKFPSKSHVSTSKLKAGLKLIGLKGKEQVSEEDIVDSARVVAANRCNTDGLKKITSLISFLDRHMRHPRAELMTELQTLQIIPCIQKKPPGFPASLSFRGGSCTSLLQSSEVFSSRYVNIVGSVHPVAVEMPEWIEELFGVNTNLPFELVVEHLKNLSGSYESSQYQSYSTLLNDIYGYLDNFKGDSTCADLVQNVNFVWVGIKEGFQRPSSVYVDESVSDLDLKPYRFPLITPQWKLLMAKLGCHQDQTTDMLIEVLREIKEKHDTWREAKSKHPYDVQKDMQLIIQILNVLKSNPSRTDCLYLPIHQGKRDFLVMLPLEQCTYCNADWLMDQTSVGADDDEEDDIFFVHTDIAQSTAQQLGVSSLTDRVMDDTDDFDMDYHQSEPLTRRLKHLLHEYTDGFSVPKELIQNAEDAGATEVCFLYDERYNLDARTSLINENMADLQGPALWAYNNEVFKPADFDSITKLSGATKEADTTKVGKFGLGFNSVYNLTDVPSFISGNHVVVFDPHKTHLGKGGMKANLKSVKNQRMLKKMSGQFKPFNGIFGCNMKGKGTEQVCPGTLFRFPLRTDQQASTSEIKKLSYSKHEMERLLKVFAESCGSLLIFTQSVCSVKFFHLPPDGDPEKPQLMLHVKKDTLKQQTSDNSAVYNHNVLLHAAREWEKQNGLSIAETCDVQISIHEGNMVDKLKLKTGMKSVTWNIAWRTGKEESATFARSGKLQGLLPLAGVAIPVRSDDELCTVHELSASPEGFYKKGHLFCFLPLPIETPFQVHINAAFALTSDRRQLCTRTTDDKKMDEAVWNEVLEKDAVSRAYVSALAGIQIDQPEDIAKYYQLWPTAGQTYPELVKSFYGLIIAENESIFLYPENGMNKKASFHDIKILDPKIRSSLEVGDIAFSAAVHYWDDSEAVVDVPTAILKSFESTALAEGIHSRYIYVYSFFKSVFLPHISDSFWSAANRDKLTLYAINSRDPAILELLKESDCIPTKPSGKLKRPSELVHPERQCAPLYAESAECFPQGRYLQGFQDPHVLEVLSTLGMVVDDLPCESLMERANSVINLYEQTPKDAIQRCWRVVKYLSYTSYSSRELTKSPVRFLQYPDEIQQQLKVIAFLPVKQRPSAWPLPWKCDSTNLARPCDLFSEDLTNLVACSEKLIDYGEEFPTTYIKETLKTMGLRQKSDICIETVMFQLESLAEEMGKTSDNLTKRNIKSICLDVYTYLDTMCSPENPPSDQNKDIIRKTLSDKKVVLVGDQMLYPEQVAFDQKFDLPPYLFKVGSARQWRSLLETLGVKQLFSFNDVLKVVEECIADTREIQLTVENLKSYEKLTHFLVDLSPHSPPETFSDRLLPDRNRYLKNASSLCFDDCEFVNDDASMSFVHQDVHQNVAKWFGVRGKREANLKDSIYLSHYSPFGQSEPLTSRLKRILSGYPCDSAIMKELLQNADDSGATELMFIKDFRSLPTKKVFCDNWESIQGPALCVYNNSYFSERDFEGIQHLGEGSKSNDPMKTGQYGVGFNAVYHLTDVPSFMTVGPGVEKTICALDPHMKYVPWATDKQPGGQIKKLDGIRAIYKDAFYGYLEDCIPLDTKGTLFRFPLRTLEMANESKISDKDITTEKVDALLKQFKEQMFESLLFLHSVKKIVIARIEDDGSLVEEYHVECKMNEADTFKQRGYLEHLQTQANNVKDHSTGVGLGDISPLETQLTLHIQDSGERKQDWLVIHQSGFSRDKDIPETLVTSWAIGDIGLLPRGGVAVPLPSNTSSSPFHGKAFCILPLPIETGLPVHINGHFALDHETRRNLWHDGSDYRSDWNKHLVEALLIPAYLSAIQALKLCLKCTIETEIGILEGNLARYYSYFPDVSKDSDAFWRRLAKSFYSELVQRRTSLFSVIKPVQKVFSDFPKGHDKTLKVKISWVPVTVQRGFPGHFNNLAEYFKVDKKRFEKSGVASTEAHKRYTAELKTSERNKRLLSEILRDLNMKVIEAPLEIYHSFVESEQTDRVLCITPDTVITFLKSHNDEALDKCMVGPLPRNIEQTPFKKLSTLKLITNFIQESSSFAVDICGLPLAMTLSWEVRVFSGDEPLIVTKFPELLMKTPDISIHGHLVQFYKDITASSPSLKPLTIDTLVSLLPQLVNAELLKTGSPVTWNDNRRLPTKDWITCLWNYLEDEIVKKSDVPKEDRTKSWFRAQLTALRTWCLFPAKNGQEDCQSFLYPIEMADQVIDLFTVEYKDEECAKVLVKMRMHCLDTRMSNISVACKVAANWDEPDTILFAISSMDLYVCDLLTHREAEHMLLYFCKNIGKINALSDSCELLMKLPFYPSFTDEMVPIEDAYIVKSSMIPTDGLHKWISVTGKQLIRYRYGLEDLYKHMNVRVLQPLEMYSQLLIPRFKSLPYADRAAHLKFIRDELLKKTETYSQEQEDLINQLKNLAFIEMEDGTLHRASDFYSNQEIVFETMCPPSAFLPCPYNGEEWHTFLVLIGLQLDVTVEHFITFANAVEQLGSFGISKEVAEKSTLLAKHLCESRPNKIEERILLQIRGIKFILPYNVNKMHKGGKVLTEIHTQYEEGKRLVCYSGSVDPSQCYISWTSGTMFRSCDNPAETEYGKDINRAYQQLQTTRIPEHDIVVKHMQNICSSVTEKQNHGPLQEGVLEVFKDVLNEIYQYFQKQGIPSTARHRLDSTNTIFLPDDKILVPPKQVVTALSEGEVIPGYLYSGPVYFGKFYDVFHMLGAAEKTTANHFALVLEDLKTAIGPEEMHANELNDASKAVKFMFRYLRKEDESSLRIQTLYLPNHERQLRKSTELVFSDAKNLKLRVSSLGLNYFLGFRQLEIQIMNPVATIALLPDQYKPTVLSQIVKNALSPECLDISAPGERSSSIIEVIRSPEFLSGVVRLVNHVKYTDVEKSLTQTEAEEIETILLELNIEEVQHLESVLYYKGDIVEHSAIQVPSFMDNEKKMFYIPSMEINEQTYMHLATAMNILIGTHLGKDVHIISKMIKSVPKNIETLLDDWDIKMCDYLSSVSHDGLTAFPPPGTLIPEKFQSFLDNGFYSFKKGEYVGYEVYDPLIDGDLGDDTSDSREGVFLVYAIVREIVVENSDPILARYVIEGRDGSRQEVSGTQLYKIIRGKRTSQSTDMEVSNESAEISLPDNLDLKSVLTEIRETLKKAWDMLGEKDRHRVKKRLYLKWHPDKNPDRVDFCTEVCKYIAIYVHKLEQGLDIDESDDDDLAYAAGNSSPDYSWFNQFTARRRRQEEYFETRQESGSSHSFNHSTQSEAYPHPQEARRWLRQAKADLDFAEAALRLSKGFNWVCSMCQQAAEKAIKSVWYNRDSQRADSIRSHDISSIASGLGNPSLAALASRLQNVVQDYNRLRYPDRLSYPRIPSDVEVYSETDAREAYRLAQEIVSLVG